MHDLTTLIPADEVLFHPALRITLADVLAQTVNEPSGTARRDTISAFNALAQHGGIDLAATEASAVVLRSVLATLHPARSGLSAKRCANVCSLITNAVARHGMKRRWITGQYVLLPDWAALLAQVARKEQRWSLTRLAAYGSLKLIAPGAVDRDTLLGFLAALEGDPTVRHPRKLLKQTISGWNACQRQVPGWPAFTLASPFRHDPYMMPLAAFPESFAADIAAWEIRMQNPDPLDPDAPLRALRADTIKSYHMAFRRLASALVRQNVLRAGDIHTLADLAAPERLKAGLRPFLPTQSETTRDTGYAAKMATQMIAVARHHLRLPPKEIELLKNIARRLAPRDAGRMGSRNRERLAQFDDPAIVQELLAFPDKELGRALRKANPQRRARGIERALAISLLIFTGIRVRNLRCLRLSANLRRIGARVLLVLSADETKTRAPLELELPAATIALLDLFCIYHRSQIPGTAGSDFLFAAPNGGARSYSSMRVSVSAPLARHAGIKLSPHLYRHIVAKIVIERHPELALDVSRRLGHASLRTTYAHYLGTETPAASRRINALLQATRDASGGKTGK